MKEYISNIQSPHFDNILEGKKTFEIRLNRGKWMEMEKGDQIIIDNQPGSDRVINVEIIDKKIYKSFKEMFEDLGTEKIVPEAKSLDEAISECRVFYTENDEQEYGVLAVEIKVI